MLITNILLLSIGLAMDAFAVSVCKGLNMTKINYRHACIIGGFFGVFQSVMPLIGWLLGTRFAIYVTSVSHWISFVLLALIGGKMIYDAIRDNDEADNENADNLNYKELVTLAVATSIDALAVGVSFAFTGMKLMPLTEAKNGGILFSIIPTVLVIGIVTFIISVAGVGIGNKFGAKYNQKAQLAGGIILILIGSKILLEGLGIF